MNGFCAPNVGGVFSPSDLDTIKTGGFTHAKLRHYHDANNIRALKKVGVAHLLQMWPDLRPGDGLREHIDKCKATILSTYPLCNIWQIFNEPNDEHEWAGQAWVFQSHMRYILTDIQNWTVANNMVVYYVLGPLSYAPRLWPELHVWRQALSSRPDHEQRVLALSEMCHYAGANCYWEVPRLWKDGSYGMLWQDVRQWSKLPTIVTEYGISGYDTGALSEDEGYSAMAAQYPIYLREIARRGAVAAYVFTVGGTPQWGKFRITDLVAGAIKINGPYEKEAP